MTPLLYMNNCSYVHYIMYFKYVNCQNKKCQIHGNQCSVSYLLRCFGGTYRNHRHNPAWDPVRMRRQKGTQKQKGMPFCFCVPFCLRMPFRLCVPVSQITITNVPAVISTAPTNDFAVKLSCRKTNANTNVITTLSLSTGTTLEASPI